MEENKNKSLKTRLTGAGFTVKGLRILLAFSFVATVLAFSVAYLEHRQYTELVGRYDDAMVRISECEASVEALVNNMAVPETTAQTTVQVTEETESLSDAYTQQTTTETHQEVTTKGATASQTTVPTQTAKETTTTHKETSSTYYVTQSGKKYHVASCSYLNKSKIAITMDRIKAEGYSPCSRCIK